MALDILQSKNAVAQVILLSYHSLPLQGYISFSPILSFFLTIWAFLLPHLSYLQLYLLSHGTLFSCLSLLLLNFCPTLRNYCLLFRTLAILLNTNSRPLLVGINRSSFCLLFPSSLTYTPYLADSIRFSVTINRLLPSLPYFCLPFWNLRRLPSSKAPAF